MFIHRFPNSTVEQLNTEAVCETKFCGIIDQFLFYIDLAVHFIHILKI